MIGMVRWFKDGFDIAIQSDIPMTLMFCFGLFWLVSTSTSTNVEWSRPCTIYYISCTRIDINLWISEFLKGMWMIAASIGPDEAQKETDIEERRSLEKPAKELRCLAS
jgi:hypothetical protein